MAGRDYILCRDCGDKLIYDGSDNIRSRLEGTYGDPSAPDWTVELVCPPCLKKIEDKQAEPVAEPATVKESLTVQTEGKQQAEPVVEPDDRFCDANCTALDHHADCVIGNPSF